MAEPLGVDQRVVARDVRAIQNLLKEVAPDLRRKMDRDVRKVVDPLVRNAKDRMPEKPLARWHEEGRRGPSRMPGYNQTAARRGIRLATGGRGKVRNQRTGQQARTLIAYALVNADAGGAVFEVAGRRGSGRNNFVPNMRSKFGAASRGIWKAWDALGAQSRVEAEILKVVDGTMAEYNRRLSE